MIALELAQTRPGQAFVGNGVVGDVLVRGQSFRLFHAGTTALAMALALGTITATSLSFFCSKITGHRVVSLGRLVTKDASADLSGEC